MNTKRKQCPICKLDNQMVETGKSGRDEVFYTCQSCGTYPMSGDADLQWELTGRSGKLSSWLRERNLLDVKIPLLTPEVLEEVLNILPSYNPREKQNKLLKAIELLTKYPGKEVVLMPKENSSLAWAENEEEFTYYIKSLMERGLLEITNSKERTLSDPLYPVVITAAGWDYLEKDQSNLTTKTQAFVAMSFDKELLSVYENATAPSIVSTGYRPYRVDTTPHLDRIDAKIIAEIKNSRFLVADVTQQKAGVYYEAGFAHGLGIPVIWCVRIDELDNVHFDTRQYNHILWTTEDELKEKLSDFILATIGKR